MIFRGRSRLPAPLPLDPHLVLSMVLSIHAENASNLTNRYLGMFLEGQVDRQTGAQTADAKTDFIGGEPVLSTGYLVSCARTQRSASGEARLCSSAMEHIVYRRMAENGFAPPPPREFCRHILSCRELKAESFKRCLHSVLRGVSL